MVGDWARGKSHIRDVEGEQFESTDLRSAATSSYPIEGSDPWNEVRIHPSIHKNSSERDSSLWVSDFMSERSVGDMETCRLEDTVALVVVGNQALNDTAKDTEEAGNVEEKKGDDEEESLKLVFAPDTPVEDAIFIYL